MIYPIYCEQAAFSDVFEPLNGITNFAFIIAGIVLFFRFKKQAISSLPAKILAALLIAVGIGSLAWHTYRNDFTFWIDTIPIYLFVVYYLWVYVSHSVHKLPLRILFFLGFFIYTPVLIYLFQDLQSTKVFGNGSLEYIVALSYFVVLQMYNKAHKKELVKPSLVVVFLFMVSLVFRQLDLVSCDLVGFGTHFMWHIFNAIVLYSFVHILYLRKTKEPEA